MPASLHTGGRKARQAVPFASDGPETRAFSSGAERAAKPERTKLVFKFG